MHAEDGDDKVKRLARAAKVARLDIGDAADIGEQCVWRKCAVGVAAQPDDAAAAVVRGGRAA